MADFKPYKVNSLPTSNIDVNGIYYVKTGNAFKTYIRNQADTDWVEQEGADLSALEGRVTQVENDITGLTSGFKGSLVIADTPTGVGYYIPTEEGTYTNAGGLTYEPSTTDEGKLVQFIYDGTSWSKNSISQNEYSLGDLKTTRNITGELTTGSYYHATDGAISVYGAAKRTDKIALLENDEIWVKTEIAPSYAGIVYFDESEAFLSKETNPAVTSGVLTKLTIPKGARYVGVSGTTANELLVERRFPNYEKINTYFNQIAKHEADLIKVNQEGYITHDLTHVVKGRYLEDGTFEHSTVFDSAIAPIKKDDVLYVTVTNAYDAYPAVTFLDTSNNVISQIKGTGTVLNDTLLIAPEDGFIAISQRGTESVPLKIISYGKAKFEIDKIPAIESTSNFAKAEALSKKYFDLGANFERKKENLEASNFGILMAGQSNMLGTIPYSQIGDLSLPTTTTRVEEYNFGTKTFSAYNLPSAADWGVFWSILYRLDAYLTEPIKYFRRASGSTSLHTSWNPDNTDLNQMGQRWAAYLKDMYAEFPDINTKAVIWIQGESDRYFPNNVAYYQNLKNFINYTRGIIGYTNVPFVVVGMHKDQSGYNVDVRNGQIKACADTNDCYFVNPDDITWSGVDSNHYDGVYAEALGEMIFQLIKDF